MCAEDNIQVCNPSTPAQYFHVLRRQLKRNFRRPLVLMTPKSLLRHKLAVSPVEELTGGRFQEVLDDTEIADPARVRRVVLCSGKVYYDLLERRRALEVEDVALVRVEQLYPFPVQPLERVLSRYRKARECAWVQEESLNMGAWSFMESRLRALGHPPRYIGRDASASPATGSRQVHLREQKELVEAALTRVGRPSGAGDGLVGTQTAEVGSRQADGQPAAGGGGQAKLGVVQAGCWPGNRVVGQASSLPRGSGKLEACPTTLLPALEPCPKLGTPANRLEGRAWRSRSRCLPSASRSPKGRSRAG